MHESWRMCWTVPSWTQCHFCLNFIYPWVFGHLTKARKYDSIHQVVRAWHLSVCSGGKWRYWWLRVGPHPRQALIPGSAPALGDSAPACWELTGEAAPAAGRSKVGVRSWPLMDRHWPRPKQHRCAHTQPPPLEPHDTANAPVNKQKALCLNFSVRFIAFSANKIFMERWGKFNFGVWQPDYWEGWKGLGRQKARGVAPYRARDVITVLLWRKTSFQYQSALKYTRILYIAAS